MIPNPKMLGVMRPLGGGDPIPLKKDDLLIGRRPTCDIQLDFENISGKHCQLRMIKGVWHVRDLASTNGTTVNGHRIGSEHGLMPDDELGIAGHFYSLDYDPIAPTSLIEANAILEEEVATEDPHHKSLMELAGLESEERTGRRARAQRLAASVNTPHSGANREADSGGFPSAPRARPVHDDDGDASIPTAAASRAPEYSDDDFFQMIQDDVKKDRSAEKQRPPKPKP
jgi:predicted component of type VI protein secretion system